MLDVVVIGYFISFDTAKTNTNVPPSPDAALIGSSCLFQNSDLEHATFAAAQDGLF